MKIAMTGATGFVGSALRKHFSDCVIIKRDETLEEITAKLKDVDVVINLAGAPIIKRWSESYKRVLIESRVETTKKLVEAINQSDVKQFISTSAVGIYPDDTSCDEHCEKVADDFLGSLATLWERTALTCNKPTAILRFGIVLGREGGALAQMLTPFRLGVGGTIGNGKMMMSWISIEDLVGIYAFLIENKLSGIYNAVAPTPIDNYTFTKALGKALHRPTLFPLPECVLELIFSEGAIVLTGSKEIYPRALLDAGYTFKHARIEEALELLNQPTS